MTAKSQDVKVFPGDESTKFRLLERTINTGADVAFVEDPPYVLNATGNNANGVDVTKWHSVTVTHTAQDYSQAGWAGCSMTFIPWRYYKSITPQAATFPPLVNLPPQGAWIADNEETISIDAVAVGVTQQKVYATLNCDRMFMQVTGVFTLDEEMPVAGASIMRQSIFGVIPRQDNGYSPILVVGVDSDSGSDDDGGGGGGCNCFFTSLTPMTEDVGGWEAGSTFLNIPFHALIHGLLYPYQYPAFDAFVMAGQSTPIEVGASLLVDPTFTWSTINSANVAVNTIDILNITDGTTLASNIANDGTQAVTLAAVTKATATSHVFRVRGDDTHGNTFTRDATYYWQWKAYYGESASASLNEAGVEGLRVGALAAGFAGTYVFVADAAKYKYIAYAAALGLATTFKDQSTNLDVPMEAAATVAVTNVNGVLTNYNVHRTTNMLGGAINIVVT